ncbi:unnamed protein product, partial [Fusarium fujikuroi]
MDSVEGLAVLSNVFVLEVEDHPGFSAAHRTENTLCSARGCIILFLQVKAAIFVARFVEVVSLMRRGPQRNVGITPDSPRVPGVSVKFEDL